MPELDELADRSADVTIVGAGPVGLSAALRLGRDGVRVLLLDRRAVPSDQPRAHVVNGRTMELFRSWGIADRVRAEGLPPELALGFGWLTRMDAEEFARIDAVTEQQAEQHSAERLCSCAQDRVEAALRDAVAQVAEIRVELGAEAVGYRDLPGAAELDVRDASGAVRRVRSRFVLACDGASSPLRALAGVGTHQTEPLGRKINIYFHADLTRATRRRPFLLWFVHSLQTSGIFITLAADRWVYSVDMAPGETTADYGEDRCRELIRAAVGDPTLDPDIRSVLPWRMDTAVADRFRAGRLFFVGDAAHRFPPTGGFGMNSGIQDADNLAWKLSLVLAGTADDALLDTYEAERKPVAEYNAAQSLLNAHRQRAAAAEMARPEVLHLLAAPEGAGLRAQVAADVQGLREEFHSLGQQFGHVYEGPGVIDDGTPAEPSTITEYRPTARPGARAPHVRLRGADGRRVSTVALATGGWTVLVAGAAGPWRDAAERAAAKTGLDVGTHAVLALAPGDVPPAGDYADDVGVWQRLYGLEAGGAVLVRPDGHVAARFRTRPDDPADALLLAFERLLRGAGSPVARPADTVIPFRS